MIAPAGWHDGMSYEDALAGYLEIGMSREAAKAFAWQITHIDPHFRD
jgi:hypothetical protein